MPDRRTIPVSVVVNFSAVSYNSTTNQWTGSPTFNVPATTPVQAGLNTIVWTLRPAAVPHGFDAVFDPGDGIAFDPGWPGGPPSMVSTTVIQANDDFTTPPPTSETFEYSVDVRLVSESNSTLWKDFSYDPDVENESANLTHVAT